jgi:hypothetical protein
MGFIIILLGLLLGVALIRNSFRLWRIIVRFSEKIPVTAATIRHDWGQAEDMIESELQKQNESNVVLDQDAAKQDG